MRLEKTVSYQSILQRQEALMGPVAKDVPLEKADLQEMTLEEIEEKLGVKDGVVLDFREKWTR